MGIVAQQESELKPIFFELQSRIAQITHRISFEITDGTSFSLDRDHPGELLAFDPNADATISICTQDLTDVLNHNVGLKLLLLTKRLTISGSKIAGRQAIARLVGEDYTPPPPIDYTDIPRVTEDLVQARADLGRWGYCLIGNALSREQVTGLREEIVAEADHEVAAGYSSHEGGGGADFGTGPNQRMLYLVNLSDTVRELLVHPYLDEMLDPFLGPNFTSFSFQAIIAAPGGQAQMLHPDQLFLEPPVPFAVYYNVGWYLDDVTEENGATRILPGSHLWGDAEPLDPHDISETVAAAAPAGTMMIFDGRLWHGGGANVVNSKRHVVFTPMCRYFIRPLNNYFLMLKPEVEERLSDKLKARLGYRVTNLLGSVGPSFDGQLVSRNSPPVGRSQLQNPYA